MTENQRRVFISGIGAVTPLGMSANATWQSLLDGRTSIERVPDNWHEHDLIETGIWSVLPDACDFKLLFSNVENRTLDPVAMLAILAADEAVKQAGIQLIDVNPRRGRYRFEDVLKPGVYIGTGIGGAKTFLTNVITHVFAQIKQQIHAATKDAKVLDLIDKIHHIRRVNEFSVSMLMPNAVAAAIGIRYGVGGTVRSITQACSAGTTAIGTAYQSIRRGDLDLALAGGAEYLRDDHGSIYKGFACARTLCQISDEDNLARNIRPFDVSRSGFLYAEGGAAMLVLESESSLMQRNATPIAEITGFAETFDHYSMMIPEPQGTALTAMLHQLLRDADIDASAIDYINAHGTGTPANDQVEASALMEIFGNRPLVNSTKSLIGHTIGASGAIEAVVTALSLRDQKVHLSANIEQPCADINIPATSYLASLDSAMSISSAFGGHNSGLILRRA